MVPARLGRRRVVILDKGSVELPSDIAGQICRPFEVRVDEVRNSLYQDLRKNEPHEERLY
jgi:predicted nucleotide-binding protein